MPPSLPITPVNNLRNAFLEKKGAASSLVFMIGETARSPQQLSMNEIALLATAESGYGFSTHDRDQASIIDMAQTKEAQKWIAIHAPEGSNPKTAKTGVSFSLTEDGKQQFDGLYNALAEKINQTLGNTAMRDDVRTEILTEMRKEKPRGTESPQFTNAEKLHVGSEILANLKNPEVTALLKKLNIQIEGVTP